VSTEAVAIVRAIYDAINAGDAAAIVAHLLPDIRIEQTPALPWGGTFEGLAGFAQFSKTLRRHIESRVAVERMFEAGEDVLVIGRTIGHSKANGAPFDVAIAHVLTLREGRVTQVRYFIETPAMLAALSA
jgi:uncharacterized protein